MSNEQKGNVEPNFSLDPEPKASDPEPKASASVIKLNDFFDASRIQNLIRIFMMNGGSTEVPAMCLSPATALAQFNGILLGFKMAGGTQEELDELHKRIQEAITATESNLAIPNADQISVLGKKAEKKQKIITP